MRTLNALSQPARGNALDPVQARSTANPAGQAHVDYGDASIGVAGPIDPNAPQPKSVFEAEKMQMEKARAAKGGRMDPLDMAVLFYQDFERRYPVGMDKAKRGLNIAWGAAELADAATPFTEAATVAGVGLGAGMRVLKKADLEELAAKRLLAQQYPELKKGIPQSMVTPQSGLDMGEAMMVRKGRGGLTSEVATPNAGIFSSGVSPRQPDMPIIDLSRHINLGIGTPKYPGVGNVQIIARVEGAEDLGNLSVRPVKSKKGWDGWDLQWLDSNGRVVQERGGFKSKESADKFLDEHGTPSDLAPGSPSFPEFLARDIDSGTEFYITRQDVKDGLNIPYERLVDVGKGSPRAIESGIGQAPDIQRAAANMAQARVAKPIPERELIKTGKRAGQKKPIGNYFYSELDDESKSVFNRLTNPHVEEVVDTLPNGNKVTTKVRYGAVHENSKTGLSLDFSTNCARRCSGKGSCLYCYVEHGRLNDELFKMKGNNKEIMESPYMREILAMPDQFVKDLNNDGGLRAFSFGDYRPGIDDAQFAKVLEDAASRGLKIRAITKEPELIKKFGKHPNLHMNVSWDELGKGVTHAEQLDNLVALKKEYPNMKIRSVALNKEQLYRHLDDPRIDVVTPYHGVTDPEKLMQIIRVQNPELLEQVGEARIRKEIAGWESVKKEADKLREKYPGKMCCAGGKCAFDDTKCGQGVTGLGAAGILFPGVMLPDDDEDADAFLAKVRREGREREIKRLLGGE